MGIEQVPILGKMIKRTRIINSGQNLKRTFLSKLTLQQIYKLCEEKGIETFTIPPESVTLTNPSPKQPIPFRQLVWIVVQNVPGDEIIGFCEKEGIECRNFKEAFGTLAKELGSL